MSNLSSLAFLAFDSSSPLQALRSGKENSTSRMAGRAREPTIDVEDDLREPFLSSFASKQLLEKQQDSMVMIVDNEFESQYKQMSLRAVLQFVNDHVDKVDRVESAASKAAASVSGSLSGSGAATPTKVAHGIASSHVPVPPAISSSSTGSNNNSSSSNKGSRSAVDRVQLRDIRRLDYTYYAHEEPFIFVRRHAVIFSFTPLRAIVMADMLIFFLPDGADEIITVLMDQLRSEDPRSS
jgi:hypothetical protein